MWSVGWTVKLSVDIQLIILYRHIWEMQIYRVLNEDLYGYSCDCINNSIPCYGLNCVPLNSLVEPPPPCDCTGNRAFKEVLRLNEVLRVEVWSDRSADIRRVRDTRVLSPFYEDIAKSDCLQARKRTLMGNQIGWCPDFGLPSLRNCEKINYVVQTSQSIVYESA